MVNNNLPPASQQWARDLERRVSSLEAATRRSDEINRQQNVTLNGLTQTVSTVVEQQGELTVQQNILDNHQMELENLVNAIPITTSYGSTGSNFAIPNGSSNIITINVPWAEGKSRVSVFAVATSSFYGAVAQASLASWRVGISGNYGSWGDLSFFKMDSYAATSIHSRNFTGSTSFPVVLQSSAGANHGTSSANSASLQVIAVFS